MTDQLNRLGEVAPASKMYAVKTSYMAYFALTTDETAERIKKSLLETSRQWEPHLEIFELDQETNVLTTTFLS